MAGQIEQLRRLAQALPAKKAWVVDANALTFGDLYAKAGQLAASLAASGTRPGDVVAFQLPNVLDALVVHAAVAWVGGVSLPLGVKLGRRELEHALCDSGARLLIVDPQEESAIDARRVIAERDVRLMETGLGPGSIGQLMVFPRSAIPAVLRRDVDPAVLIYTSGTTSKPKGVLHSERNLILDAESIIRNDRIAPDESLFIPSSVSHIAGVVFLLVLPFVQGNTVCTVRKWNVEAAIDLMRREKCTWAAGAPTFLQAITEEAAKDSESGLRLRVFRCGGADVPPSLIRDARSRDIQAYRAYGCSEFPTITGCGADGGFKPADTDGRVHPHVHIRMLDPVDASRNVPAGAFGEILVKGPEMFLGYTDATLTSTALDGDGWLHTGDLGTLDAEGFLTITGRIKDLIIRKGENISPREVEEVISTHASVMEAAVVGIPDRERGQLACAFVVLHEGASLDMASLERHLETEGLARFKWPERIETMKVLPRTASGKVRKEELRALATVPDLMGNHV